VERDGDGLVCAWVPQGFTAENVYTWVRWTGQGPRMVATLMVTGRLP
jgi:hypothetical protein